MFHYFALFCKDSATKMCCFFEFLTRKQNKGDNRIRRIISVAMATPVKKAPPGGGSCFILGGFWAGADWATGNEATTNTWKGRINYALIRQEQEQYEEEEEEMEEEGEMGKSNRM